MIIFIETQNFASLPGAKIKDVLNRVFTKSLFLLTLPRHRTMLTAIIALFGKERTENGAKRINQRSGKYEKDKNNFNCFHKYILKTD